VAKNLNTFSYQDFIDDLSFIDWVKNPDGNEREKWESWIQETPPNLLEMKKAKRIVLASTSFQRILADDHDKVKTWESIRYRTWKADQKKLHRKTQINKWMRFAAGIVIGFVCIFLARTIAEHYNKIEIRTAYGEIKTIYLPDSSSMVINANTVVSFYKNWSPDRVREVWIDGEAYLEVIHLHDEITEVKASDKFVTHLPSIDVEVLGTSFNVKERKGVAEVSLKEGSVSVSQSGRIDNGMYLILKPGEIASFIKENGLFEKQEGELQRNFAWRERLIKLERTKVKELISQLEDFYGIDFLVFDKTILEREVDGEFPLTDTADIRFILSSILEKEVAVRGNQIIIR
jgi:transmembrane sensor